MNIICTILSQNCCSLLHIRDNMSRSNQTTEICGKQPFTLNHLITLIVDFLT